jgi:hypothetical protein
MAAVGQKIHEHDVVRLQRHVGRWPEGRQGTVVSEKGRRKMDEIADDQGAALDFLSVTEQDLELVWSPRSA